MFFLQSQSPFKRSYLIIAPVLLVMAGIVWSIWSFAPRPMYFETAQQFKDFAVVHGLFTHSGWEKEIYMSNLYVANRTMGHEAINTLSKADCGETEGWKGVIWVAELYSDGSSALDPSSIGGHVRIWGKVLAAGDPELLDRMEDLYQRR